MLDDMRKFVRLGLEAVSSQGSEDVVGSMRSRAQGMAEHLSTLAAGFMEWSAEARASLLQELKDLVARQVEEMGVATKKDLDRLTARLERVEARLNARAKSRGDTSRAKSTSRARGHSSSRVGRPKAANSSRSGAGARRQRASRGSR